MNCQIGVAFPGDSCNREATQVVNYEDGGTSCTVYCCDGCVMRFKVRRTKAVITPIDD